jgi:hypothetical protein
VESRIAHVAAVVLGLCGVAFLAVYPLARRSIAREKADIERAGAPIVSVPLEQLQAPGGQTLDVTIPNDDQWKRITKRLGSPAFLLAAASAKGETRESRFPRPVLGLTIRVWRNGTEVALLPTDDPPDGYSSRAARNVSKFTANAGDRLRISARIDPGAVPAGSVFLLAPRWSASIDGEGAAFESAAKHVLGLASALVGVVFVLGALVIALGRPEGTTQYGE